MRKKVQSIPVNLMAEKFGAGIAIGRATITDPRTFKEAEQSHRDEYHLLFLQEVCFTPLEVDFQQYQIKPSSVMYIHPNQVHVLAQRANVLGRPVCRFRGNRFLHALWENWSYRFARMHTVF